MDEETDDEYEFVLSLSDKIFATGVFLRPAECIINGIKQWRWVSDGFVDENYCSDYDGFGYILDVYDYADNLQGLLIEAEENYSWNASRCEKCKSDSKK
jgi:hypothetical protein